MRSIFSYLEESPELQYTSLIFTLFVIPRFFIRLGIPFALSAFIVGIGASHFGWQLSHGDVVKLFASLGIISLFLFAGIEVNFVELRENKKFLSQHIIVSLVVLISTSIVIFLALGLPIRPAIIMSLALLTPSTGFILDTIDASTVPQDSKFWIRSKAIAAEIVALFLMFVLVRSLSLKEFSMAALGMAILILALPLAFRFFVKVLEPVAPKSEFGFLLMVALLAGMITKKLGAYYLIGAFVVGVVARRFEENLPRLTSKAMIRSIKSFTSFFIPFYFFYAGASVRANELTLDALAIALVLLIIFLPLRIYLVLWHRKYTMGEQSNQSFPIAASLLPNFVFGLVLAELLKTAFQVPAYIVGAVIIYTIGATLAPPILLKYFWKAPQDYSFLTEGENSWGASTWDYRDGNNK